VNLQIQTIQNSHTQAATRPSSNPHRFGDIKALVQQEKVVEMRQL